MKKISNIVLVVASVALIFNYVFPVSASALSQNGAVTNDEFLQLVYSNSFYSEYEDRIISDDNMEIRETISEEGERSGLMLQYEVELETEEVIDLETTDDKIVIQTTVTSLLSFIYDDTDEELSAILVDYSNIETDDIIVVKNLTLNEQEIVYLNEVENDELVGVSEEISELKSELIEEANLKVNEGGLESLIQPAAINCLWWQCTVYETGGGYPSPGCSGFLGIGCTLLGSKITKWGTAICQAGVLIACYVPSYKVCINGYWETKYCPIQS